MERRIIITQRPAMVQTEVRTLVNPEWKREKTVFYPSSKIEQVIRRLGLDDTGLGK